MIPISVAASHSTLSNLGGPWPTVVAGLPGSSVPGPAGGIDWVQQYLRRLQWGESSGRALRRRLGGILGTIFEPPPPTKLPEQERSLVSVLCQTGGPPVYSRGREKASCSPRKRRKEEPGKVECLKSPSAAQAQASHRPEFSPTLAVCS